MAVAGTIDILASALWPQGDARDPLGVWGFRGSLTGDASGGSIKATARVPAGLAAAYVYTVYSLLVAQISGNLFTGLVKSRILTNWPNMDELAGVQAYGNMLVRNMSFDPEWTAPIAAPDDPMVTPLDRFLLLFDPRPSAGVMELIELELGGNTDLAVYSFEGYGYFWDRAVLNTPGGPRHPGSS